METKTFIENVKKKIKTKFKNTQIYFRGESKIYPEVISSLTRCKKLIFLYYEDSVTISFKDSIIPKTPCRVKYHEKNRRRGISSNLYAKIHKISLVSETGNEYEIYDYMSMDSLFEKTLYLNPSIKNINSIDMESKIAICQHLGFPTSFIDFSKQLAVALYFACSKHKRENGRIIISSDSNQIIDLCKKNLPYGQDRMDAQSAVILRKEKLCKNEYYEIKIPRNLKSTILKYIDEYLGISSESLYQDTRTVNSDYSSKYNRFYSIVDMEFSSCKIEFVVEKYKELIEDFPTWSDPYKRCGRLLYYFGLSSYRNSEPLLNLSEKYLKIALDLDTKKYGFCDAFIDCSPLFLEGVHGHISRILSKISYRKGEISEGSKYNKLFIDDSKRDEYLREELKTKYMRGNYELTINNN